MSSPIFGATFQAVALSALSNLLAQGLQAYRQQSLSDVDVVTFLHFVLLALLVTPPNYAFQGFLERSFPTTESTTSVREVGQHDDKAVAKREEKLSVTNTAIKFALDQGLGAPINTILFITLMSMFKGLSTSDTLAALQQDFWPMLSAGYRLWPMVTLLNLVVVPFEHRMLVGNTAGLGWGVYMSLRAL